MPHLLDDHAFRFSQPPANGPRLAATDDPATDDPRRDGIIPVSNETGRDIHIDFYGHGQAPDPGPGHSLLTDLHPFG